MANEEFSRLIEESAQSKQVLFDDKFVAINSFEFAQFVKGVAECMDNVQTSLDSLPREKLSLLFHTGLRWICNVRPEDKSSPEFNNQIQVLTSVIECYRRIKLEEGSKKLIVELFENPRNIVDQMIRDSARVKVPNKPIEMSSLVELNLLDKESPEKRVLDLKLSLELILDSCVNTESMYDHQYVEEKFDSVVYLLDAISRVDKYDSLNKLSRHRVFEYLYEKLKSTTQARLIYWSQIIIFVAFLTWSFVIQFRRTFFKVCERDVTIDLDESRVDHFCFGLYFTSHEWFNWLFFILILMPIQVLGLVELVFLVTGVKPCSYSGVTSFFLTFVWLFPRYYMFSNKPYGFFSLNTYYAIEFALVFTSSALITFKSTNLAQKIFASLVGFVMGFAALYIFYNEGYIKHFFNIHFYSLFNNILFDYLVFFFSVFSLIDLLKLSRKLGVYIIASEPIFKFGSIIGLLIKVFITDEVLNNYSYLMDEEFTLTLRMNNLTESDNELEVNVSGKSMLDGANLESSLLYEIGHVPQLNKYYNHLSYHAIYYYYLNQASYLAFYRLVVMFFGFCLFYNFYLKPVSNKHVHDYELKRRLLRIRLIRNFSIFKAPRIKQRPYNISSEKFSQLLVQRTRQFFNRLIGVSKLCYPISFAKKAFKNNIILNARINTRYEKLLIENDAY